MHLHLWYIYFQITLHGSCTNSYYQQSTRSWLKFERKKKKFWFSIARLSVILCFQQITAYSGQLGQLPAPLIHIDLLRGYKVPTPMWVLKFLSMALWCMGLGSFLGLLPSQLWVEIQTFFFFCRRSMCIKIWVVEKENEVKKDCSRTGVSVDNIYSTWSMLLASRGVGRRCC